MALEVASFIGQLDKTWPVTGDQIAQGDDQIRLLKATLQKTFPGMKGEVLRVVGKASGFTPSVDESTVIYNCTAAITVTLPALGGVVAGTYWFVNAGNGAVTLTPSSAETVNGAATVTVASGTWALITKASSTNWIALGIPAMTAAAIVAALGTTPVAKATDANTLDGYDSANFARIVNGVAVSAGAVTISVGVTTVNGNDGAITAAQIAAAATAGYGYTPADSAHTHSAHTHSEYVSTNMTHGAVGSLCFASRTSGTTAIAAGGTIAGSSLAPASIEATANMTSAPSTDTMVNTSGTLSGTWQCLGFSPSVYSEHNATLWQRIS